MNRRIALGIYTLALSFIVGLWMVIAPFVLKAQPAGAMWSPGTINDVAVGGILVAVSLAGIGLTVALGLRDAVRAAGQRPEQADVEPAA